MYRAQGVIIGCDGFGFAPEENGAYKKIPQIGNVVIEDNVDIGSGTTIDRATLGSTIIRNGVKLDNQIQVAHNVEIGKNTVIAAQTGIAGSTRIGKNCQIGGQVGIVGHILIGNRVKIQAQSGIGSTCRTMRWFREVRRCRIRISTNPMCISGTYPRWFRIDELEKNIDSFKDIKMSNLQKTIINEVSLYGVGLHTGNEVNLTFKPAAENTGIRFVRTDFEGQPTIEAEACYVTDTQRGTNIEKNGVVINTSEHVFAAIVGLDIDNIIIEIEFSGTSDHGRVLQIFCRNS